MAFSNRHPPIILPNIYPSADLSNIFLGHFTSKVVKLRASIASEPLTSTSELVTETTTATFCHLKKCHNLQSKNAS